MAGSTSQSKGLNGSKKYALGGTILGVPVVVVAGLLWRASALMATTNQTVLSVDATVRKDHEPRIRKVEMDCTQGRSVQQEIMRSLARIEAELKELRKARSVEHGRSQ